MKSTRAERQALYDYHWRLSSRRFLRENPLCTECSKRHLTVAAAVVDHIVPHDGNRELFWNKKNWQSLCRTCHDTFKQQLERSGVHIGCDANGIPLDPNHHWNSG